jgi:flagellin
MTVVNTNIGALQAQASMSSNQRDLESALERLSSGLRINSAADDAAGMAIANKLDAQIKGLNQAIRNANDGKALIDTAEGAQIEVNNLLQRLRELAVQSANDTNSSVDRLYIEKEADQILNEINRIGDQTRWNGMRLLDGTFDNAQFQVGHKQNEDIDLAIRSVKAAAIGTNRVEGVATHIAGAADSIDAHNITVAGHIGSQTVTIAANSSAKTAAANINQKS